MSGIIADFLSGCLNRKDPLFKLRYYFYKSTEPRRLPTKCTICRVRTGMGYRYVAAITTSLRKATGKPSKRKCHGRKTKGHTPFIFNLLPVYVGGENVSDGIISRRFFFFLSLNNQCIISEVEVKQPPHYHTQVTFNACVINLGSVFLYGSWNGLHVRRIHSQSRSFVDK